MSLERVEGGFPAIALKGLETVRSRIDKEQQLNEVEIKQDDQIRIL